MQLRLIIDKTDTERDGFNLNMFWKSAELYKLCKREALDIVCASEIKCNKIIIMQQAAYTSWANYTSV